ncbi:hypothetical protein SERLA73DRAFT_188403 [Serpula lacrymans var. lacrymans S7.3]|uniref:C2H2-type domain-containing protein n=1 Tax=Serpula lacrymans var. lacrymans (strain S7.3) TaxID=936435 RepID=F8QB93_SERL3|nr:hypothetical protein SERLA73DRAFT_188403 [Serpula lacrymans var. lacrymans S7.3]
MEIQQYLTQESASGNNNVQDQMDHQNVAADTGIQATEESLQPTRVHDTAPRQRTTADDRTSMIKHDSQQVSLMVQPTQGERPELSSGPEKSFFAAFGSPAVGDLPFTRSQTEPPTRNLAEALNLLNVKSEEIERLERALAQERSKFTKLQGEVGTLKSKNTTMEDSIMQTDEHQEQSLSESMDLTFARAQWDLEKSTWAKERSTWEMERAGWDAIRAAWDVEREKLKSEHTELTTSVATLTSSADSLNDARASAEKDRDFFREQYSQASGYVSSVRAENAELERRATIAEGQARDGIAMYKGLFETQIKTLKGDVSRWKGIAELLQEKDQRTNDEIRRRAGEEPELREQCERLQGHLEAFEGAYRRLSGAHRQGRLARHKLDKKVMRLRKEKAVLQIQLENMGNAIKKGLARSLEEDFTTMADASLREDEDEDMYTCMWRIDGGVEQCPESFDCIKDMEGHMVLAGHIQGPSE